jgi:GT2 family glycosyltransferase/SAM-dependent methyltransferase/glycosyltransferase involved in cell wall biosynthesis
MGELAFTGERFLSNLDYPEIAYEHWHRYLYASGWVAGKNVLDIACGEGYGSYFLAKSAARVLGVDISPEAVLHATTHYLSPNLEFLTGSVDNIPVLGERIFDVIVSFETIEHVPAPAQAAFLREVKRLLKPGGIFIVSTPNKHFYSDVPQYKNEYHLREFQLEEFKQFLGGGFGHVEVLGQRIYPVSLIWNLDSPGRPWREHRIAHTERGLQPTETPKSDLYDLAVCSDAPVAGADNALMLDLSERIWRLRDHEIYHLKNSVAELQRQLAEKDAYLERLKDALREKNIGSQLAPAAAGGQVEPAWLPPGARFDVSIIIPLYNKAEYTQRCLETLAQDQTASRCEVVLVDNASTDNTPELLRCLEGDVTVLRNENNEGFVRACNQGARAAQGKYLLFLNNDTQPCPGWLDTLTAKLESDPRIGAVGAKLVYPDGKLQEAGGIIFSDGSGWNFGKGDDPAKAAYNRAAEVDYCSGACLLVRRELFEQLNGFDLRYVPAYYEDVDLCFGIRRLGFQVVYCPEAVVVHFEGVTAGTDLNTGYKRFQGINQEKFVAKWQAQLSEQELNPNITRQKPTTADRARLQNLQAAGAAGLPNLTGLNVLVVDPTWTMYDRAAGCLRLHCILKILRQQGCNVTFIARDGGPGRYREELGLMGIKTYGPDKERMACRNLKIKGETIDLKALLQEKFYDLAWISFYHTAEAYLPEIRQYSPKTKILIDNVDIHFLREMRQAELEHKDELLQKALATRVRELGIYAQADAMVVVTKQEQEVLEQEGIRKPMFILPTIHEVEPETAPFEMRSGLLFVGNFNHPPNQDAVLYFAAEVLPKIAEAIPDIKFYVVGDNPPEAVRKLECDRIIITGYVPQTKPYLNLCRISVAPLRYGAGIKGKIGEALGNGLPVVTTPIGAEGMGLKHGEHFLVAEGAEAFAASVIRLYRDAELWARLVANGRKHLEAHYTSAALLPKVKAVFSLVAGAAREELASLVMLTHNQLPLTKACLESVLRHTREPYELVVVDNASTDATLAYLRELEAGFKRVPHEFCRKMTVIANAANLGFAAGNNLGMAVAGGEYVVLINNDVVVTPGWLGRMLACARREPKIGLVGPMTNYVTGPQKVENPGYDLASFKGLDEFALAFAREHAGEALPHWRVVGFCMLIKRAVIEKIGGLDGRFGLGNYEDDDFSLRAALAGFESWIAQDCYVHHVGSQTFAELKVDYRQSLEKNWGVFKQKWGLPETVPLGTSVDLSPILREGFKPRHYCAYR